LTSLGRPTASVGTHLNNFYLPPSDADFLVAPISYSKSKDAMENIENSPTRKRGKYHLDTPDVRFIVWAALVSIGLIVVSVALGVGIDPDVSTFASP
jgi:hypothetical protein